jgi:hypothetical protein
MAAKMSSLGFLAFLENEEETEEELCDISCSTAGDENGKRT